MIQTCVTGFDLQPVLCSTLPDIAAFVHEWRGREPEDPLVRPLVRETVGSIERRLRWLLSDSPAGTSNPVLGFCVRDSVGALKGVNLCFPVSFWSADKRILGLCSGTFFVEHSARSMGFYLFKKCLNIPGYSLQFASTCNSRSSDLWRAIGASPVPNSETEYIIPIRADNVIAAYAAYKTSSRTAGRIACAGSRIVNPIVRGLMRPRSKMTVQPCQDWDKLSELSWRHRSSKYITTERSPSFLRWRYGTGSPLCPCAIYLFRDEQGNEGWFSLAQITRGKEWKYRVGVLLDVVWPRERMSPSNVFEQIFRVAGATADAVSFRRQPSLDPSQYHGWMITRELEAPRAFVSIPKGLPRIPLDAFDFDDSDYIAWTFPWRDV
jgi:hypothetical protein